MSRPTPISSSLLCAFALLVIAFITSAAAQQQSTLAIYNSNSKYDYIGCYTETTNIANTTGARALSNGVNEVGAGNMTVSVCLDFCGKDGGTDYTYAGIEYARECWCATRLSSLSMKLADGECNLACEGNKTQACGGSLRISLYMLTSGSSIETVTGMLVLLVAAAIAFNTML